MEITDYSRRWDVGFNQLNHKYASRAKELALTMSEADAVALLSDEHSVPLTVLQLLAPLTRVTIPKPSRELLLEAVKEYPYLSLALVNDKGGALLDDHQKDLTLQARKTIDAKQPESHRPRMKI